MYYSQQWNNNFVGWGTSEPSLKSRLIAFMTIPCQILQEKKKVESINIDRFIFSDMLRLRSLSNRFVHAVWLSAESLPIKKGKKVITAEWCFHAMRLWEEKNDFHVCCSAERSTKESWI